MMRRGQKRGLNAVAMTIIALVAATALMRAQAIHVGVAVPGFTLRDMRGRLQNFHSSEGKVTVVMFFSTRCPMSNAFNYRRNVLYHDYRKRVRFIVVDSNANESLDEVRAYAKYTGFDFPVYQDVDNQLANQLAAISTTENFVLDGTGVVRYHGYIEDSPNPARTTKQGLRLALDAVLAGEPVALAETRAVGCAIRRTHLQKVVDEPSTR
jgi:peroxiredoxin